MDGINEKIHSFEKKRNILLQKLQNELNKEDHTRTSELIKKVSEALNLLYSKRNSLENDKEEKDRKEKEYAIGKYVYGLYEAVWYVGKVIEWGDEANEIKVQFIGYNNIENLNCKTQVMPYEDLPEEYYKEGRKCVAIYDDDGQYYSGVVMGKGELGHKIAFDHYGNIQDTPRKHIRMVEEEIYREATTILRHPREKGKKRKVPEEFKKADPNVIAQPKKSLREEVNAQRKQNRASWQAFHKKMKSRKKS